MSLSAWMLFAAPYVAPATADPAATAEPTVLVAAATADDVFHGDAVLSEQMMRDAAGGQDVAVDISDLGVNIADQDGLVRNVDVNDTVNGQIANNTAENNSGITTIFNNTGNGVVFQSSVQVNIFLGDGGQE
ncbi:MAG: hypothetical protein AAGJ87_01285 [Pseudomonadota bacterium]